MGRSRRLERYNPSINPLDMPIDPTLRGSEDSNNSLFKIQYQKNFGSNAFARVYAYSNYSTWFVNDPIGRYYLPLPESGVLGLFDDELDTHTRGVALQFADQLSAQHLLQGFASYTYAGTNRWYNSTPYDNGFTIQLRDPAGGCYNVTTGAAANCYSGNAFAGDTSIKVGSAANVPQNLVVPGGAPANAQCQVVASGYSALDSTVTPKFTTISLDDNWQATRQLALDLGVRYDRYVYGLADTSQQLVVGGSNAPYFSQYNAEHCFDAKHGLRVVPNLHTIPVFVTARPLHGPASTAPDVGAQGRQLELLRAVRALAGADVPILATLFAPSMAAGFVADDATFTEHLRTQPDALAAGMQTIAQTVADFGALLVGGFVRRRAPHDDDLARAFDLFPRLAERRGQAGGTLSGGEQQMLAIGRALMCRPRLLCLDEPTMGLAPRFVQRVLEAIVEINAAGTSILMVEQNVALALQVAHRGYVLAGGAIVASGSAASCATRRSCATHIWAHFEPAAGSNRVFRARRRTDSSTPAVSRDAIGSHANS